MCVLLNLESDDCYRTVRSVEWSACGVLWVRDRSQISLIGWRLVRSVSGGSLAAESMNCERDVEHLTSIIHRSIKHQSIIRMIECQSNPAAGQSRATAYVRRWVNVRQTRLESALRMPLPLKDGIVFELSIERTSERALKAHRNECTSKWTHHSGADVIDPIWSFWICNRFHGTFMRNACRLF